MVVLEFCHALFAYKMEDAATSLTDLSLSDHPGENVSKLSNKAQRFIKIVKGGHCLPYQLGSTLILQVYKTQSDYFNRSMFNLLDKELEMEKAHGPHRNTKFLDSLSRYSKFGPIGVCIHMREQYGEQVKSKSWPALTATIPQGNLENVQEGSEKESQKKQERLQMPWMWIQLPLSS